jgi:hypothetical protein
MPSPVRIYQAEMHLNLGFFATWLPGDSVEIGDVGVLADGRFRRLSSLANMGMRCKTNSAGSPQNVQYTSTKGTAVSAAAAAGASGVGKAEIEIEFSAEGAFLFHATGLQARRLEDLQTVNHGILTAYNRGEWQKEWLLVEAVHTADCATVIVSQDTSAKLVLTANASSSSSALALADPKVSLNIASSRGRLVNVICGRAMSPLYSCLRVHDSIFSVPSLTPARGATPEAMRFERVPVSDLLDA